jgi:Ca2+-binding RTX toxin-like protein
MNISGSAVDDDLRSGNRNDTINLGAGNDYIEIGGGNDAINGGEGFDLISYHWNGGFRGINVHLATGQIIDQFGDTDTVSNVEEIQGTAFNDRMSGTANADHVRSLDEGRDRYNGGDGLDVLSYEGEQGSQGIVVDLAANSVIDSYGFRDSVISFENIIGTAREDPFTGDELDNVFTPGAGNDTIDGGLGQNSVDYFFSPGSGINADLISGSIVDPFGNTDFVSNISAVFGTESDDVFVGNSEGVLFEGNGGTDSYTGGSGFDTVTFERESGSLGVVVRLGAGTATDTYGNSESLISIDGVRGSLNADDLRGNGGVNTLIGFAGGDTLTGGAGADIVDYSLDAARGGMGAVTVNLTAGTATDGFADADTLATIEGVIGTRFADTIVGSSAANRLSGQDGNDTLTGGGAADIFVIEEGHLGAGNVDTITDYNVVADTIQLAQAMFAALLLGTPATAQFKKAAGTPVATTADHHIMYSTSTGNIFYDPDGAGGTAQVLVATLTGSPNGVTNADFDII